MALDKVRYNLPHDRLRQSMMRNPKRKIYVASSPLRTLPQQSRQVVGLVCGSSQAVQRLSPWAKPSPRLTAKPGRSVMPPWARPRAADEPSPSPSEEQTGQLPSRILRVARGLTIVRRLRVLWRKWCGRCPECRGRLQTTGALFPSVRCQSCSWPVRGAESWERRR